MLQENILTLQTPFRRNIKIVDYLAGNIVQFVRFLSRNRIFFWTLIASQSYLQPITKNLREGMRGLIYELNVVFFEMVDWKF